MGECTEDFLINKVLSTSSEWMYKLDGIQWHSMLKYAQIISNQHFYGFPMSQSLDCSALNNLSKLRGSTSSFLGPNLPRACSMSVQLTCNESTKLILSLDHPSLISRHPSLSLPVAEEFPVQPVQWQDLESAIDFKEYQLLRPWHVMLPHATSNSLALRCTSSSPQREQEVKQPRWNVPPWSRYPPISSDIIRLCSLSAMI